jgi:predicted TIM-barrel fold metal-dependent hydrolase
MLSHMATTSSGAQIRAGLDHPVIDADGHSQEFLPAINEYLAKAGVSVDVYGLIAGLMGPDTDRWATLSQSEREHLRAMRPPWWATPTKNTLDFATATLPGLLHTRLDELGIDYAVVYPTLCLGFPSIENDDLRAGACRAINGYHADLYAEHRARLTPVALIPMHTPEEAIQELHYAVEKLGLRAVMIASHVNRPVAAVAERAPDLAPYATWLDTYGLDSVWDYDPFWQRCEELGVSVATHGSGMGWGSRRSVSNYMYNQIGHFAAAGDALCKSLLMGGVTHRFPKLRFAFLEGGVAWACSLLCDQLSHWEKRNANQLHHYNPAALDTGLLEELVAQHAGNRGWSTRQAGWVLRGAGSQPCDDWEAAGIESADDLIERFVPKFFFGCEADDPMTSTAFNTRVNPQGARLGAMFGSDIGHWDVPNMARVLAEAYESVEAGWLDEEDFRDFVFGNAVRFYTDTNPAFFSGTCIESEVSALVEESSSRA